MKTIESTTAQNSVQNLLLSKRLSKYTTDQLQKKLQSATVTLEEVEQIRIILTKRGIVLADEPTVGASIAPVVKENPSTAKLKKAAEAVTAKIVVAPVVSVKSSDRPISDLVDDIYALEDKKVNVSLCNLFPEEGCDDYEELPEDVKASVREFHKNIFNPEPKTTEVKVEKTTKTTGKKNTPKPKTETPVERKNRKGKDNDITDAHVIVGDSVEFTVAPGSRENGKKVLVGEVKRVYVCPRAGKEYVKIAVGENIFFKRLNAVVKKS